MTPEERAKLLLFGDANWPDDGMSVLGSEFEYRVKFPRLVAAIRDAVKAETEACAKIAKAEQRDASTGGAYAVWNRACNRIANRIRERTP